MFAVRCAQITPLTGGKKDTTPPKPIVFSHPNASINFKEKFIEIEFDEFISLKNVTNEVVITPQVKQFPNFQVHGKKLKIEFNDTLANNTTYKLTFGDCISDVNESNVLQNFEYVFSTGNIIDSLTVKGRIMNSADKKPVSDVLIGLYDVKSNDSIVYREKPLYMAKSNKDGQFIFKYLPNTLFKIVGIKDSNHNWLYDGSDEQIAFSNSIVNPADSSTVVLSLFKERPNKTFIKKSFSTEYGKAYVVYNKTLTGIADVKGKGVISYEQNYQKDTLIVFYENTFDTLKLEVHHELNLLLDTLTIRIPSEKTYNEQLKEKKIIYTLKPDFVNIVPFFEQPGFVLNAPVQLSKINSTKIYLYEQQDTSIVKIPFTIFSDKALTTTFKLNTNLKPETNYTLSIAASALFNDNGRTNDPTSFVFKTNSNEDYAQLNMKMLFPKKEQYIVMLFNDKNQLINEQVMTFSLAATVEKSIHYERLIPGTYSIKIIKDVNKNGLFDTGDYFLKKQPETIYINPLSIKLMSGWEIENEWLIK